MASSRSGSEPEQLGGCWSYERTIERNKAVVYLLAENPKSEKRSLYRFGKQESERVVLGPIPLAILALLLERAEYSGKERVAQREEIAACWIGIGDPDSNTINTTMTSVRKAIGDTAEEAHTLQYGVFDGIEGYRISPDLIVKFQPYELFAADGRKAVCDELDKAATRRQRRAARKPEVPPFSDQLEQCTSSHPRLDEGALSRQLEQIENLVSNLHDTDLVDDLNKHTPPKPPLNPIRRAKALEELRDAVFSSRGEEIGLTALYGMSGIGKTVLAQLLCECTKIVGAFPGGIYWFTVGQGKKEGNTPISRINALTRILLRKRQGSQAFESESSPSYGKLIRDEAILVILDDVWLSDDVEPFRTTSPRSALVFTTQIKKLADRYLRPVKARFLDEDEATDLFCRQARIRPDQLSRTGIGIIKECDGHALALSMLGAALAGASNELWTEALQQLSASDISEVAEDLPGYKPRSLAAAFNVSLKSMQSDREDEGELYVERYLYLAVLLEDIPASPPILQTIWNTSVADALKTAKVFVDRSLALPSGQDSIVLHDLLLSFVRQEFKKNRAKEFGDSESLELIHDAVRKSLYAITMWPAQLASQLVGRLSPHQRIPNIENFIQRISQGSPKPWFKPIRSSLEPSGTGSIMTLTGHSNSVTVVAVTPDGGRAVSASRDRTLRVWNLNSGKQLHVLEGHSGDISAVAVTPDGGRAVSASRDRTLRVWDLNSGKQLRVLEGHSDGVWAVAVTPDGERAVSASRDQTLRVWDLNSGKQLHVLEGHCGDISAVAVTPDGERAVSASSDSTLRVWDLYTGRQLHLLKGHSYGVSAVAVTPDGERAVSASLDHTLRVWDLHSGRQLTLLGGHGNCVVAVAVTPDGDRAVSASEDGAVRVWDLRSGRQLHELEGHGQRVIALVVTADGERAVSASEDGAVRVWDLHSGRRLRVLQGHSEVVLAVAVTPDGEWAVSASRDRTLRLWDLTSERKLHLSQSHCDLVRAIAVTADGKRAVSASSDHTLWVWDFHSGRQLHVLEGHCDAVSAVAVTADGERAVSASSDHTLRVWDLHSGRQLHLLKGHHGFVEAVAVTPNGELAVSASWDRELRVWDLQSGRQLHILKGHGRIVRAVAVTADGKRAVSASSDHTLRVWDLRSGRQLHLLEGHRDGVSAVAITPDGERAVSASWDHTLRVWDLTSGVQLHLLEGHNNAIHAVAIAPDGERAVSASLDHTLRIWDLQSGRQLHLLKGHRDGVRAVVVTPDGKWAVSTSRDRTLRLWDLKTGREYAQYIVDDLPTCCSLVTKELVVVGGSSGRVGLLSLIE